MMKFKKSNDCWPFDCDQILKTAKPLTIKQNLLSKQMLHYLPIQLFNHQKKCVLKVVEFMRQYVPIQLNFEFFEIRRSKCLVSTKTGSGKTFMILSIVNFLVDKFCELKRFQRGIKMYKNTHIYMYRNWSDDFGENPRSLLFPDIFPAKFIDISSNKKDQWLKTGNFEKLIICIYVPGELMRQWANAINAFFGRQFYDANVQIVKNKNDHEIVRSLIFESNIDFIFILAKDSYHIPECTFVFYDEVFDVKRFLFQQNEPLMAIGFLIGDFEKNNITQTCNKCFDELFSHILIDDTSLSKIKSINVRLEESFVLPEPIYYYIYYNDLYYRPLVPKINITYLLNPKNLDYTHDKYVGFLQKVFGDNLNELVEVKKCVQVIKEITEQNIRCNNREKEIHIITQLKDLVENDIFVYSDEIFESKVPSLITLRLKKIVADLKTFPISKISLSLILNEADKIFTKLISKLDRFEELSKNCLICFEQISSNQHIITDCCQIILCTRCLLKINFFTYEDKITYINCPHCRRPIYTNTFIFPANEYQSFDKMLKLQLQLPDYQCIEVFESCFKKMIDYFLGQEAKTAIIYDSDKLKNSFFRKNLSKNPFADSIFYFDSLHGKINFEKKMTDFFESSSMKIIIIPYSLLTFGFNIHFVDNLVILHKNKNEDSYIGKFKRYPRVEQLKIFKFLKY